MGLPTPLFLFAFLPIVVVGYAICPYQWRNIFLLLASLLFIAWGGWSVFLLFLVSVLTNTLMGVGMERTRGRVRAVVLFIGILWNILFLLSIRHVAASVTGSPVLSIGRSDVFLPLGISFYTLHGISYLVEMYRGRLPSTRSPCSCALYLSFFPHVLAGPLSRSTDFFAQVTTKRQINLEDIESGCKRIILGLGKKILIADRLALIADAAFSASPTSLPMSAAWLGALGYGLQIYFDFSGYSDIAIGIARLFGFRLPENFQWPYVAISMTDFWRRWHMSFMGWLREYVYIPLGGNRGTMARTCVNIFVVFLLSGLWHVGGWTFLLWGAYFGVLVAAEKVIGEKIFSRIPMLCRTVMTFLLVTGGWVIFRSPTVSHAMAFLSVMGGHVEGGTATPAFVGVPQCVLIVVSLFLSTPLLSRIWEMLIHLRGDRHGAWYVRDVAYLVLLVLSLSGIAAASARGFLYTQF